MMSMLCNCCVRELLILARTWFAFGLPSKTGCDSLRPSHTAESRLEGGGVNRANLKFTSLITTTNRVSVRNINESEREGAKQIVSE
jgi:hypothetical protein